MKFTGTRIPDVVLIEPEIHIDGRGFFLETWQKQKFAVAGIDVDFVQDNQSLSKRNTLRGLHYQITQPQGKLVRVTAGEIFDVAVDIRRSSTTFGQWVGMHLSAKNKRMLWIPPGFAHGFYVISDLTEFQYKCTDYYTPEFERCIRWDDGVLQIEWPIDGPDGPIISEKDRNGQSFESAEFYP